MNRYQKIAAKMVKGTGDVIVEVHYRYALCTVYVESRQADLKVFMRDLVEAERQVLKEAAKVVEALKKIRRKGMIRNVGINPSDGVVGVMVEFDKPVDNLVL